MTRLERAHNESCPCCGSRDSFAQQDLTFEDTGHLSLIHVTWRCPACGASFVETYRLESVTVDDPPTPTLAYDEPVPYTDEDACCFEAPFDEWPDDVVQGPCMVDMSDDEVTRASMTAPTDADACDYDALYEALVEGDAMTFADCEGFGW